MNPIKDRILVKKVDQQENKTESGIFLGNKPKNTNDFEILIIGNDVKNLKVGMFVRKFQNVDAIPIPYNDQKCFFLRETDIEFVL